MYNLTKEAKNRIYITLLCLFIFFIGMNIRVPGVRTLIDSNSTTNMFFNLNFSFFMLGITPFISGTIVTTILSSGLSPIFTKMKKTSTNGKDKLKIWKYFFTAIFAFLLSMLYIKEAQTNNTHLFINNPNLVSTYITIGSLIVTKISYYIEDKGIGNGVSILVLFMIVKNIISQILNAIARMGNNEYYLGSRFITVLFFIFIIALFIIVLFLFNRQKRKISVDDENSDNEKQSQIAFAYNSAGIMPVYFTSILLLFLYKTLSLYNIQLNIFTESIIYYVVFAFLMMICSYLFISPKKRAKKMELQGLIIPGIEPGIETQRYLNKEIIKTVSISILFLIVIDVLLKILQSVSIYKYISIDMTTYLLLGIILTQLFHSFELLTIDRTVESLY